MSTSSSIPRRGFRPRCLRFSVVATASQHHQAAEWSAAAPTPRPAVGTTFCTHRTHGELLPFHPAFIWQLVGVRPSTAVNAVTLSTQAGLMTSIPAPGAH